MGRDAAAILGPGESRKLKKHQREGASLRSGLKTWQKDWLEIEWGEVD